MNRISWKITCSNFQLEVTENGPCPVLGDLEVKVQVQCDIWIIYYLSNAPRRGSEIECGSIHLF